MVISEDPCWFTPTRDTHTYCRAFGSGAVTTCFWDLCLSRLGFETQPSAWEEYALAYCATAAKMNICIYISGCQVSVSVDEVNTLTTLSLVIGPVADCYKQCYNHFWVNVSTSLIKQHNHFSSWRVKQSRYTLIKVLFDSINDIPAALTIPVSQLNHTLLFGNIHKHCLGTNTPWN